MQSIKVLGSGCANCRSTIRLISDRAEALGVPIQLEKVEEFADIARFGVMSTPGVVVDGVVVHSGGVPSRGAVDGWLG